MPLYEYACVACGGRFEVLVPRADAPQPACPRCGNLHSKRLLSTFAVVHAHARPVSGPCGSQECACRSRSED